MTTSRKVIWIFSIAAIVVIGALTLTLGVASAANILYVGPTETYTTIQSAVDVAKPFDIVIVRDGNYTENVDVSVDNVTILSENGYANCIVNASDQYDHIFNVTADYVNISGFTVKNTTDYSLISLVGTSLAGICLIDANRCVISNNYLTKNNIDIMLFNSNDNILKNNNACCGGIFLLYSSNNILTNNNASLRGVHLQYSGNNTIENNIASNGIFLDYSGNNTLTNNTMFSNWCNFGITGDVLAHFLQNIDQSNTADGKPIYYWIDRKDAQIPSDAGFVGVINSSNITVKDLTLTKNGPGVLFVCSNNSKIENVNASNNPRGICFWHSSNNTITNSIVNSNVGGGISLYHSSENTLKNNIVNSNDLEGLNFINSSNNSIVNNTIANNKYIGIDLYSSKYVVITNNRLENNGINIGGWDLKNYNTHDIESNTVNGKPFYYYKNEYGLTVPDDAGAVILANCSDMIVKDIDASNSSVGIKLAFTVNSSLMDNVANSSSLHGFLLYNSSNNIMVNNTAHSNGYDGIHLSSSSNNSIVSNIVNENSYGISLSESSNNGIVTNTANSNSKEGITLSSSSNNSIANNILNSNGCDGIHFSESSDNSIVENTANANNCNGILFFYSSDNIITKNTFSSNQWTGINFMRSSNNTIYLNNFINNTIGGVSSFESKNIWNSTEKGTYVLKCQGVMENYLGNYWDDYNGTDVDNDGIGDTSYVFGLEQDNYPLMQHFGEYFMDLNDTIPPIVTILSPINGSVITIPDVKVTGFATDDTGIIELVIGYSCWSGGGGGCQALANVSTNVSFNWTLCLCHSLSSKLEGEPPDPTPTPPPSPKRGYLISVGARDRAGNWGAASVRVLCGKIDAFDTKEGTYPSISGMHNGTITPSCNITVSKLYTYPCMNTGGHTEHIKIWNNATGWNFTATWDGYIGDWHNLTFNNSFTLYANETYNYTIVTGSYPQIIHESPYNATGGVITCEEFVDINGKRHEGWIPAILLS